MNEREEALNRIADALNKLGLADASTPMGAIEEHGLILQNAAELIADGLHDIADALRHKAGVHE